MKQLRDSRLWALAMALAFLVLWLVSIGVAHSVPPQEPAVLPQETVMAPALEAVGVSGWCLIGVGFLGILLWVIAESRFRFRHRRRPMRRSTVTRSPRGTVKTVYGPAAHRMGRPAIQRRYYK